MPREERQFIDLLTDKHELLYYYYRSDEDLTQILDIECDGRPLQVIVPLFYDGTRIGEVVHQAMVDNVVFLLCRHDKPFDAFYGTLGLLVVAIPQGEGRYRAVIAHTTFSLERLNLYPVRREDDKSSVGP
jgi:hypothetical protein